MLQHGRSLFESLRGEMEMFRVIPNGLKHCVSEKSILCRLASSLCTRHALECTRRTVFRSRWTWEQTTRASWMTRSTSATSVVGWVFIAVVFYVPSPPARARSLYAQQEHRV